MPPYATGACLCGAITYTLASAPTYRYLCVRAFPPIAPLPLQTLTVTEQHCPSCKKSSGSAFMHNLAFPSSALQITSTSTSEPSTLRTYTDTNTQSGKPLLRSFCGSCGSPVKIETAANPGKVFVPAGLIEEVEVRDGMPESENWVRSRVGWFEGVQAATAGKGRKRRRG